MKFRENRKVIAGRLLYKQRLSIRSIDDHIVVTIGDSVTGCEGLRYPYSFYTSNEVPKSLGDI